MTANLGPGPHDALASNMKKGSYDFQGNITKDDQMSFRQSLNWEHGVQNYEREAETLVEGQTWKESPKSVIESCWQ